MLHRASWCEHKEINDHCLTEGHDINIRESMTIASQRVLMYKRRTWIFLLKCRQTPRECLTFVRLTQKNVIVDFFFFSNFFIFFWKWFSMILWSMIDDMMWWCMTCYDFLFETISYAYMDVWIHEWIFFFIFYFSFILIWE